MSIATEIEKIQGSRNTIRSKLVTMGLATSADKLETLANTIKNIPIHNAVNATVKQGEAYSIPAGYHDGSGTVTGLDNPAEDAAKYQLQAKTVTPEKTTLTVTPDQGSYGLSSVTVEPIPDDYQNVSSVTATAADVLTGKVFVPKSGTPTAGTMANNGAVYKKLDTADYFYTIPKGYHDGKGTVEVSATELDVTPKKDQKQTFTPDDGFVFGTVTVNPIPDNYIDTTDATATAGDMLDGKTAYVDGVKVTGTIPVKTKGNLAASGATVTVPAGYYAEEATKTVTTAERAATTLTSTKKGTDSFEYVASNPQTTGYVTADETKNTATKTVTLTMSGGNATMSDGENIVETRAQAATRAETNLNVAGDEEDSSIIYLSASNNQGTGYIYTASNKTASKTLKLTASGKTVSVTDSSGDTVYGSADVASVEKVSGSINGMTTTTFTQTVNKFVGSVEVTLTNDIENALKEI